MVRNTTNKHAAPPVPALSVSAGVTVSIAPAGGSAPGAPDSGMRARQVNAVATSPVALTTPLRAHNPRKYRAPAPPPPASAHQSASTPTPDAMSEIVQRGPKQSPADFKPVSDTARGKFVLGELEAGEQFVSSSGDTSDGGSLDVGSASSSSTDAGVCLDDSGSDSSHDSMPTRSDLAVGSPAARRNGPVALQEQPSAPKAAVATTVYLSPLQLPTSVGVVSPSHTPNTNLHTSRASAVQPPLSHDSDLGQTTRSATTLQTIDHTSFQAQCTKELNVKTDETNYNSSVAISAFSDSSAIPIDDSKVCSIKYLTSGQSSASIKPTDVSVTIIDTSHSLLQPQTIPVDHDDTKGTVLDHRSAAGESVISESESFPTLRLSEKPSPAVVQRTYAERQRVPKPQTPPPAAELGYCFHLNETPSGRTSRAASLEVDDGGFAGVRDLLKAPDAIRSSRGTVRGVKNRVRAGIATFHSDNETTKSFLERERGRLVLYVTSMGVVRATYAQCVRVRQILRQLMVEVDERDLFLSMANQQQLRERTGSDQLQPPLLFLEGQLLGGCEAVEQLNETGELRKMLKPYKSAAPASNCGKCGGFRMLPCGTCNGSKKSAHRNYFTAEWVILRCCACDQSGLVLCDSCSPV